MSAAGVEQGRFRPVARISDEPLGLGVKWLDGVDYLTDPALDDNVVLYVLDPEPADEDAGMTRALARDERESA